MTMYRAEVLGSLLRPAYLAEAREKHQAGELPDKEFKKLQDKVPGGDYGIIQKML